MNSILINPHNHAPAVMPDDVWGDHDRWQQPRPRGATLVLPPKKTPPAETAATGRSPDGLRIGTETPRRSPEATANQLEVRQIHGRVLRLDPEISTALKVPRQITYQSLPVAEDVNRSSRGEGKDWGRTRTQSVRWIIGTGLGVSSLVVVALALLPLINDSNAERPRPGQTGLVLDKEEGKTAGIESANDLLRQQSEAEQLFRGFASASIVEDILPLVRDEAAVAPLIRSLHRPARVTKAWLPPDSTRWNVIANDGRPFAMLEGTLPDFSKFSAYCVLSANQLRLDWKATTGYGTATFEELTRGQGDPTEIRARILLAPFYTAIYPEAEFQSYQLISPDGSQAIWGYTHRGEAVDGMLGKLFQGGDILESTSEPPKITVRLAQGPAGSLPNQWVIAVMWNMDWINL